MMSEVKLYHGDCLDSLPTLTAGSVNAIGVELKERFYVIAEERVARAQEQVRQVEETALREDE